MEQEHKNWKPLLIAAVAAVAVIALLLVLFFSSRSRSSAETIILPEASVSEKTQPEAEPEASPLYELTRENVQSVLEKSVARPASYHQSMQLSTMSGSTQRTQSVELWVKGALIKAQITDTFETRTVLADESVLYLWYDEEQTPVKLSRGEALSADSLAGIPTYENILSLSKSQITQAAFVTLSEPQADCIYVSAREDTLQQEYWVSLDSGLLCKQMMLSDGELVYLMEQTALEVFPEHDEALEGVFCLPDGTQPFAQDATEA